MGSNKKITQTLLIACLVIVLAQESVQRLQPPPTPEDVEVPQPRTQSQGGDVSEDGTAPCSGLLNNPTTTRMGLSNTTWRWESFYVYIDPAYDDSDRALITDGMYILSKVIPCLTFGIWTKGSTPTGDYVHIKNGTGCTSYLGRIGGGQEVILGKNHGCMTTVMIMHELLHALGVIHEHQRPDRDDYVRVHWENLVPGSEFAYYKYSGNDVSSFGVPYNIRSIMHYSSRAFSKNGEATMLTSYGQRLEWPFHLQQTDVDKLRAMYEC